MANLDYIVDITGLEGATGNLARPAPGLPGAAGAGRPWLSIHWKCCQTYSRIYLNRAGDAYEGRCPKCGSTVRALVGKDGTDARFFSAE